MDEPLSALDPFLRIQMRAELRRWQKELKLTFIHVTHSQEEAMALADTMVVMNHGTIEQQGSPHEIYNRPSSEFVARFMGGRNVIAWGGTVITVRSDHMQLQGLSSSLELGRQALTVRITDIEYQGTHVLVGLQAQDEAHPQTAGAELTVMVPEDRFMSQPFQLGQLARVVWSADAAHYFTAH